MEFVSKNAEETIGIARDFGEKLFPKEVGATIVGLYGDLGAGKTTFMKGLALYFGIKDTIQSPTFVIMKIYELEKAKFQHLIHIDSYRIEKGEELTNLGWQHLISNPKNLICIEWPERVLEILPEHTKINFKHVEENERKISFA